MSKQRTAPRDLLARERMTRALDMRKSGATLEAISNACGYGSRSSAHKAIRRALAELPVENATELRQMECIRLDELLKAYWQRAKEDISAAYLVLRIAEQRAKLLGLQVEAEEVERPYVVIREVPNGFLGEDDKPLSNGAVSPSLIDHVREYGVELDAI